MTRWMRSLVVMLVACCLVVLSGCGSGSNAEEKKADLEFTDVEVTCERADGWFGARGARFEITGSVKNNTEDPVNRDNLPRIKSGKETYKPDITQDKLLAGETCDFSYEGEIDLGDGKFSKLFFKGSFDFSGLDDADAELNDGVQSVADEYAKEDADEKAAREKEEKERKDAEKKKQKDIKDLNACVGKTAEEALEVAEGTDYESVFVDSFDVDVTKDVESKKSKSDARKAKVAEVEISEGSWISSPSATFKLDYTDPEAAKKREEEEAERKKQEEEAERKKKEEEEERQRAEEAAAASKYEYAYVRRMSNYSVYYLIDLDEMTATYFGTNDSGSMIASCSGDLENGLTIDFSDYGYTEQLQFKRSGDDSVAVLIDANGLDWEYTKTDVFDAEAVLASVS